LIIILTISDAGQRIICQIYDKHLGRMIYTATKILGSARGEDAVHDVFVKMIEKFENNIEDLGDKPGQFFVILARNHSLNILNKDKFDFVELDDEDVFQLSESSEDVLLQRDSFERLVALIRQLKPDTRRILESKYISGYTNKEIAETMGISQTAVSTRIDKAKKKLREMYSEAEAQT